MTKKKKILISIVAIVLAAALITSALLVIMIKKFRIKEFENMNYSNHTSAKIVTLGDQYKRTFIDTHFQNGTELIQNNTSKYGLYSNISGTIVIPTNYSRYTVLHDNPETNKSYFKFYNTGIDNEGFVIFDEMGNKVFKVEQVNAYNSVKKIEIKSREIDVDDDYEIEEVEKTIEISDIRYGNTFYSKDNYYYESWIITDKNGSEYVNIYSFEDGQRELEQTIGESVGNNIDNNINPSDNMYFLTNGKFIFVNEETKVISSENSTLEIKIFNDELELKNKVVIEDEQNIVSKFRIGNYYFIQQVLVSSEDDYSFKYTDLGETSYYKLKTHKINLKSGKHTNIKTSLFVKNTVNTETNLNANPLDINTTILNAYIIENKEISTPNLMLVNEDFDYKNIEYKFSEITKISKNRFLISNYGTDYKVINKTYEVIADLSNFTNIFTTEENIIASDSNYTYICNHDGLVIKRYEIGSVLNVRNNDYYIVMKEDLQNNVTNYVRAHNGKEFEIILTISNTGNDIVREHLTFNDVTPFIGKDYAYLLATQNNGSTSNVSIFNFEGVLLNTFEMKTQSITPNNIVYDNCVIIKISDQVILMSR